MKTVIEILLFGGAFIVTAAFITAAVGAVFSRKIKTRVYSVPCKKLESAVTVCHLSDLHESKFGEGQSELISVITEASPDVIVITGDMVEDTLVRHPLGCVMQEDSSVRGFLESLPGIAPTYMVYGNHEGNIAQIEALSDEISALGIHLLHRNTKTENDKLEEIVLNGEKVLVCGADDPYFYRNEIHTGHKSIPERIREDSDRVGYGKTIFRERLSSEYAFVKDDERLTLLLSHRPEEYGIYRELSFDAAFSGHAHGGQWRLPPFINGVYAPNQGLFPPHAGGIYRYGSFTHIVSRGLSKKRMVRIFNPPEVCVVKFIPSR